MPEDDTQPIKLHCMYTQNYEPMLVRFLSGLQDICTVELINLSDLGKNLAGIGGGEDLWRFKIDLLCNLADPSKNGQRAVQLVTDIDMMVYGEISPTISEMLEDADILFQTEWRGNPEVNIGIIAFRPSEPAFLFWNAVRDLIIRNRIWDQKAVNIVLASLDDQPFKDLRMRLLPETFWAFSQSESVGKALCHKMILHHANCVTSQAEKWDQLNRFKSIFSRDDFNHKFALREAKTKLNHISWYFGDLNREDPYATIRIEVDGSINGHRHRNESKLHVAENGIYFLSESGRCTTFFDEYYYDAFRRKILCVGKAMEGDGNYHYLLSTEIQK
jgi:hypothetical protein